MNCKCKSAPDYHRDDCLIFNSDGSIKNNYDLERDFNLDLEKEVIDFAFYFRLDIFKNGFIKAVPCEFTSVHERSFI